MTYASWGWREPAGAVACWLRPSRRALDELRVRLESLFGGHVTLWASGRAALDAAFRAIAADRPGRNIVWMPSLLCRSVAERAAGAGLTARFYDIRPDLTPDLDEACARIDSDTACLVVPHLYGRVTSLGKAAACCRKAGAWLVEDCAASFLVKAPDGRLSGLTGDVAIFSFNLGKTLVAGGGGALLVRRPLATARPEPWPAAEERAQALARIGLLLAYAWPSAGFALFRNLPWQIWQRYAPQPRLGLEMLEVDARLALIQWQRWPELEKRRLRILDQYAAALGRLPGLRLPQYRPGALVTRFFIEFPFNINDRGRPRHPAREMLLALGVQTHLPYAPLHLDPGFGSPQPGACPVSEAIASQCLAVPSHPGLSDREVRYVCDAVGHVLRQLGQRAPEDPESGGKAPVLGGQD